MSLKKNQKKKNKLLKNKEKPRKYNPILPIFIANRYNAFLKEMMRYVYKIVNKEAKPIKFLFFAQKGKAITSIVVKQNINNAKEIVKIFNELKKKYKKRYSDKRLRKEAERIFNQTNEFNRLEQSRMLSSQKFLTQKTIANEIILGNTSKSVIATKQVFIENNVKLIKSIPDKFFKEIEQDTMRIIEKQGRAKELAEQLRKRYKTSKKKSNLIARDQISKLNGNLAKQRQQDVGITKYIWRTSQDERVRASHASKNGKTFKWSEPPSDTGHPGEDYQCRCIAEGILEGILE